MLPKDHKVGFFQRRVSQYDIPPRFSTAFWKRVFIFGSFLSLIYGISATSLTLYRNYKITNPSPKVTCPLFTWQEDAQAVYDSDPIMYKHLDRGGIKGKACENLPHK